MGQLSQKLHVPQGVIKNSYDEATAGMENRNNSWGERAVHTVLATAMLPLAFGEELTRGVLNIPSEAAGAFPKAAESGKQAAIASDSSLPTDERVIAGLKATQSGAGAFTGLGNAAIGLKAGVENASPAFNTNKAVGNLEPGNPSSTSIPRSGDRLVINQGQLPTCGPVSCGMVLNTAGIEVDIGVVIAESGVSRSGTTMPKLVKVLNENGLPTERVLRATVEDIAAATAKGDPAIVRMNLDRGGHAVVVDGVTVRNGQPVVAIRDPAGGRQYFTPVDEFRANFSGEAAITKRSK
jgi:hypothetical protein